MQEICATESKFTSPIVTNKSYVWYMPAVLLTVGITIISLWEAPHLPPPVLSLGDKVLHGIMYLVLAITWIVPVSRFVPKRMPYVYVSLAVTAYGALMEVLQHYCTLTRSGEMMDVYADLIGAVVGVALVATIRRIMN